MTMTVLRNLTCCDSSHSNSAGNDLVTIFVTMIRRCSGLVGGVSRSLGLVERNSVVARRLSHLIFRYILTPTPPTPTPKQQKKSFAPQFPGGGTSQFAPRNHSCTVIPWTNADSQEGDKTYEQISNVQKSGGQRREQADGAYCLFFSLPGVLAHPANGAE